MSQSGANAEAGAVHGAEPAQYQMPYEVPNVITLLEAVFSPHMKEAHAETRPHPAGILHAGPVPIPVNPLFSILYMVLIVYGLHRVLRKVSIERPGRLQNFIEAIMGGLRNFFLRIMGPVGEKYIPYLGSLWLFILISNLAGLVPGLKAPTSAFQTTIALGLCTFCYVQFNAIKESGFGGWLYHLLGSPTDAITWCLAPLFFFLEAIGELVKPLSLSLRLFGNIFGEDKLLASFLGMGMMFMAAILGTPHPFVGLPLHVIFYPLVVLTSTIQATVFALLASIYIVLLLPHESEHEGHGAAGSAEHTGPAADLPHDSAAAAQQA